MKFEAYDMVFTPQLCDIIPLYSYGFIQADSDNYDVKLAVEDILSQLCENTLVLEKADVDMDKLDREFKFSDHSVTIEIWSDQVEELYKRKYIGKSDLENDMGVYNGVVCLLNDISCGFVNDRSKERINELNNDCPDR